MREQRKRGYNRKKAGEIYGFEYKNFQTLFGYDNNREEVMAK